MKPSAIIPAPPTTLAPPLLEPEAALVQRLREAAITLPDADSRASMLATAQDLAERADGMKVRKPDDYTLALDLLKEVKEAQKIAAEAFESVPEIKRIIEGWRDSYTKTLNGVEAALKNEMKAWQDREEKARQELEAKARAAASASARAKQDRLAQEARDAAAKAKADGDKVAAKQLAEEAKAIAAAPVAVAPVHLESRVPKGGGAYFKKGTIGEVTDPVGILRWIVEHPEHAVEQEGRPAAITFSASWLNLMAKSGVKIPGLLARTR